MCKQHLNAFSIMTRSLECFGFRHLPGNVTSFFVDATLEPAERCLGAALRLEHTATTVARARKVQKRLPIVDKLAGRPEDLACRADIYIALLVERELFAAKRPHLCASTYRSPEYAARSSSRRQAS